MPPVSNGPSPEEIVALAVSMHQTGHLDEAEELYRRALESDRNNADANHFYGVLHHQRGHSEIAIQFIRLALQTDPKYVPARINLGNVYKEMERYEEAAAEYRKALAINPNAGEALNNLGTLLRLEKKYDEAIDAFERSIAIAPRNADTLQNLGNALRAAERFDEALTAYRRAIEIDPKHTDAHLNLGRALYSFGRVDEATIVYSKWLEADPDNAIAQHMLAACRGDQVPQRCSDAFVKESFDAFAGSFDEVLQRLDYRAPKLVADAVADAIPTPGQELRVLDAGCGTGLCGESLRPYASRLVGIDLSPKMVEKASLLKLYDELLEAELTHYMAGFHDEFDLIVSADTLVYFGSLEDVFAVANESLRSGGVLVFTVEEADPRECADGYRLNPHGRYSHTRQYIESQLARAGFESVTIDHETLRKEVNQPVAGLVVTARLAE